MSDLQALAAFVRARLDEDEQIAQAASADLGHVVSQVEYGSTAVEADEQHITRHNPARTLAEVKATREVVRLAEHAHDYAPTFTSGFASAMEHALRLFAVAHASHPDYREAWRP